MYDIGIDCEVHRNALHLHLSTKNIITILMGGKGGRRRLEWNHGGLA